MEVKGVGTREVLSVTLGRPASGFFRLTKTCGRARKSGSKRSSARRTAPMMTSRL